MCLVHAPTNQVDDHERLLRWACHVSATVIECHVDVIRGAGWQAHMKQELGRIDIKHIDPRLTAWTHHGSNELCAIYVEGQSVKEHAIMHKHAMAVHFKAV